MGYLKYLALLYLLSASEVQPLDQSTKLKGRHVKIGVSEHVGATKFKRDSNGNIIGYSGSTIELLKWLAVKLKFNYTPVPSSYRLDPLPNGSWIGVYGLLLNKEVDFVFDVMPVDSTSFPIADFTASVYEDPMVILTPARTEESRVAAVLRPFSWKVWTLFFASVAAVTLILRCSMQTTLTEKYYTAKKQRLRDFVMWNVQLIFGQGAFEGPAFKSPLYRTALCGWMLGILVLTYSYTSTFISYAAVVKLGPQVETIEDLAYRSQLQPLQVQGRQELSYLNSENEVFRILAERFKKNPTICNTSADAVAKVGTGCCALIYPRGALSLYAYYDYMKTSECRISISKEPQLWFYFAFAAQKGSPYTTLLSKEILRAKEVGLVYRWVMNADVGFYKCLYEEKPKIRTLTLKDLREPLIFLLGGVSISVAAFIVETFLAKTRKSGPQKSLRNS